MSVDVEDYFQVSAFEKQIPKQSWPTLPSRVERNTRLVLDLFDRCSVKATFFTLGWVAERFPDLVREIVHRGHELASHGYAHVRVVRQSQAEFREDVTRTKALLEQVAGVAVAGYRAASYSIGRDNLWALDVLEAAGYRYSSSIYPIRHDLYGMPEAPRFPFRYGRSGILEVPITTVSLLNRNLPCGGGGYFRLFPYQISRWAIRRVNRSDHQPAVFYFHPWELDPEQPRPDSLRLKTRIRHYLNLERMEARLGRLLKDFRWDRMDRVYLEASGEVPRATPCALRDPGC
ncbi:MAG: polysaccharide deacetylase [Chromatiales bacterium 21-64-14]|nr:MAG: polysaccharide deacetylase [Chromatiales bacterium 21-64-14]